ncbi:MAG TPA: inositol monophosphatase family protein [Fimbriimonadaceae bacterium]|nr:inositol monophosphatase family protein [Fimbriimonadaceae bacterium]
MSGYSDLLPELERIAREAGRIAQRARENFVRELKPDGSVVTNGDREVEVFLRRELTTLVPGSTVWGEEFGYEEEGPGGLWCVDPVDGTSNYSFGSPLWGVSIALIVGTRPVLGAIGLPDLRELYLGADGAIVKRNGVPMPPVPPGPVEKHELVSYNDHIARMGQPLPGKMRITGAFVVDAMFMLGQRFRGLIGYREKLYDMAATALFAQQLEADLRYADGTKMNIEDLKRDEKIAKPWIMFPRDADFYIR